MLKALLEECSAARRKAMPRPVQLVLSPAARWAARWAVVTGYSASTRGRVTIAIGRMSTARLIAITVIIAIITDVPGSVAVGPTQMRGQSADADQTRLCA